MKILVIEDHHLLGKSLKTGFQDLGWTVDLARNGQEGLYCIENCQYSVIVVDHMLPILSGIDLITKIRNMENHTPSIMITARGALEDKLKGLDAGLDDYIVKPFDFLELVARVKALYRRSLGKGNAKLVYSRLQVDLEFQIAKVDNVTLDLTPKEFDLLLALARKPEKVQSRKDLCALLYELNEEPESNSLDVLLTRLRKKLSGSGVEIVTIRRHGFVFHMEATTT